MNLLQCRPRPRPLLHFHRRHHQHRRILLILARARIRAAHQEAIHEGVAGVEHRNGHERAIIEEGDIAAIHLYRPNRVRIQDREAGEEMTTIVAAKPGDNLDLRRRLLRKRKAGVIAVGLLIGQDRRPRLYRRAEERVKDVREVAIDRGPHQRLFLRDKIETIDDLIIDPKAVFLLVLLVDLRAGEEKRTLVVRRVTLLVDLLVDRQREKGTTRKGTIRTVDLLVDPQAVHHLEERIPGNHREEGGREAVVLPAYRLVDLRVDHHLGGEAKRTGVARGAKVDRHLGATTGKEGTAANIR
mmetsp:Transcript_668/g.1384  ORF Transcript_668/g.1384 Transcript_668/m.1384 type:complete len:299 (+) Transcript_668:640-1536(+)